MWQRFSEEARKSIFEAQAKAEANGSGFVSTEHLLLGLLHNPNQLMLDIFNHFNITPESIVAYVKKNMPPGDKSQFKCETMTPRAKRAIDLAYDECKALNSRELCPEHIFLGLVREGDGLAGRVLAKMGFDLAALRDYLKKLNKQEVKITICETKTKRKSSERLEEEERIEALESQQIVNQAVKILEEKKAEALASVAKSFDELIEIARGN